MTQMIVKLVRDTKSSIKTTPYLQKGKGKCKHGKERYVRCKKDPNQTSRDEKQNNV